MWRAWFLVLLLGGCGYQPIANFADKVLGKGVFVRLVVNLPNPKNSVAFKDLLNRVVVQRFQNTLTTEKQADSIITIEMKRVIDTSISQNKEGFTTFYRVTVYVTYTYDNKKGTTKTFEDNGYFNYAVSLQDPLVTYNNRLYAIGQALQQTLTQFVSQIAYEGKVNK
ncbi:LPS assembly lipoprotein LptE [Helicobacter ailurogastricus]|uniref:Putative lipoprotein n=1 Tax=Helicobacter ailurogastricus TaxID=1578720 RepID=A0A0K2XCF8_9HELI|nr:LPS assembly lipoprotein LptE [Helicobacter ailurogastricus]CRF40312.1 putative lipoprotein [Helicobacter ailurogastricus]CRF42379.1 putative lipoprotein [Helicobacter ailurogastricus]CRF44680.1 putative lipoprotein [Helicobacter ailurogastricus]